MTRRAAIIAGAVLAAALLAPAAALRAQNARFELNEQQITHWVFRNQNSRQDSRQTVEASLQLELNLLSASVTLTDAQRAKLDLAGRADIDRFFDEFDELKRRTRFGQVDQAEYQKVWQTFQPLERRFAAGLFKENSLFQKTLRSQLESSQVTLYEESERERAVRQYRAAVEGAVAMIELKIPLTIEQRNKLIDVTMSKTKPPAGRIEGHNKLFFVLFAMSEIPDSELQPIFLENEWVAMKRILQHGQAMGRNLQQGRIQFAW